MAIFMAKDVKDAITPRLNDVVNLCLLADKYADFAEGEADKKGRSRTVEALCRRRYFSGSDVECRTRVLVQAARKSFAGRLGGRMLVNHAGGVLENAGLALDRNTGVPFIPGSALKGLARLGAALCGAQQQEVALVFGWAAGSSPNKDVPRSLPCGAYAGSVCFLPAYAEAGWSLEQDIVTVHHHKYYRGEASHRSALDNEEPVPNAFPAVAVGARFTFAIGVAGDARVPVMAARLEVSQAFDPVESAALWLRRGLSDHGIGAKTAAGYGWFVFDAAGEVSGGKEGAAIASDYTEETFKHTILDLIESKGQWNKLAAQMDVLNRLANAEWKARFLAATTGKANKDLRAKEWYPK